MSERRMDAYYYSFTPTGVGAIDKLLGAVACAGKAFHHTEDWCDEVPPYDDHIGEAPVDWIQNAAKEAAARIERLEATMREIACDCEKGCWRDYDDKTQCPRWKARAALGEEPST